MLGIFAIILGMRIILQFPTVLYEKAVLKNQARIRKPLKRLKS